MMTRAEHDVAADRPRCYVEAAEARLIEGADSVIVPCGSPDGAEGLPETRAAAFIWRLGPDNTPPPGAVVCAVEGMRRATEITRDFPGLCVVPRIAARRVARRFAFDSDQDTSGFKTYQLNPATFSSFEVLEEGVAVGLAEWLGRAVDLGFGEIWLHGLDAARDGRGFACDLVDRAHRIAPEVRFWLSGGGCRAEHVETVAAKPGLGAVVMAPELLDAHLASTSSQRMSPPTDQDIVART